MKGNSSLFNFGPGFNVDKIKYSENKMEGYLLNFNNIKGKSKAKFLKEILGYSSGDGKILHDEIIKEITGKVPKKTVNTEYGTKYEYDIKLGGKNGITAKIIVVFQNDNGKETYRIITLYPGKKE